MSIVCRYLWGRTKALNWFIRWKSAMLLHQYTKDSSRMTRRKPDECVSIVSRLNYSYGYGLSGSIRDLPSTNISVDYFIMALQTADTLTSPICEMWDDQMMAHNGPRRQFVSCYCSWSERCTFALPHSLLLLWCRTFARCLCFLPFPLSPQKQYQ